jgi:ribosomal protein L11 methyltransferase
MPASHVELTIISDPSAFEDFIGILAVDGFEGFWEEASTLRAYMPADRWTGTLDPGLVDALRRSASLRGFVGPTLRTALIDQRNWNEAWEATIRPVRISPRFVIAPTWNSYTGGPGEIVLTIDPKMSFGTGYHETTRMMVRLLERHVHGGERVLDVGCGTGILAIAALKLGAAGAIGIDTDEWGYANARENAELNGVENVLEVRHGGLETVSESGFGVIAANIQKNVIEGMLTGLHDRLASGGRLLISGLFESDRGAIVSSVNSAGLRLIDELKENEWIALAAQKE